MSCNRICLKHKHVASGLTFKWPHDMRSKPSHPRFPPFLPPYFPSTSERHCLNFAAITVLELKCKMGWVPNRRTSSMETCDRTISGGNARGKGAGKEGEESERLSVPPSMSGQLLESYLLSLLHIF